MTPEAFFAAVCRGMGWEPTPWRVAVFLYWAGRESGGQLFTRARNPLATTWRSDDTPLDLTFNNGNGRGNWNSIGVRVYESYDAGVRATVNTLSLHYYPNIRRCFEDQRGYPEAVGPRDFTSWIGPDTQYGQAVVDFMNSTTASRGETPMAELRWSQWPLSDEHMGKITGPFAATSPNPPWSPSHPHMGVDFRVFTGTPVFAPADGEVTTAFNDGSFGVTVCLKHDSDPSWYSLFAHLSEALVSPGERVEAGTLVARSGATPNVAPHLHWQLCLTPQFPRDLSLNRDPLLVPFMEEDMGMTPAEKELVDNLSNKVKRLEDIVAGYGIDTNDDGEIDLRGEDALAYAWREQWSAFFGIGLARKGAAQAKQIAESTAAGQSRLRQHDHHSLRTGTVATVGEDFVD